jgi:4-aminobutyrate aminotransferase/(S)-3-amino-2-methylpropionate transaminase
VLEVLEREQLAARAETLGQTLRSRLQALQSRHDCIGEVRGLGAMVAMELVRARDPAQPDPDLTRALVQAAGRSGLVLLSCGVYSNVIRFLAPLTISEAQLGEGLSILEACLEELRGG